MIGVLTISVLLTGIFATGLLWYPMEVRGATTFNGYIVGIEKQATAYTMLGKVNAARQNASVGALKWDATLENAAVIRAREVAIYFSHTRPTGAAWNTVCSKLNAENLYVGYKVTASTANGGWMNSTGHRANRLNSAYKSYAAAAFQSKDGVVYWVELFSRSTSASTLCRNTDITRKDLPVKMTDGYLSLKSAVTDFSRNTLSTNSMRMGGNYYMAIKNWNKEFSCAYILFSKGLFASSNTGVAKIDRYTGEITPIRAGVVKFYARTSTASGTLVSRVEVIRPQKVSGLAATAKVHAVSLKWNNIAGVSGYEIYRSTSANGTYTKVRSVSATTTSYTQTGLNTGAAYYYKVRAYVQKSTSTTRYSGHCATPVWVKVL